MSNSLLQVFAATGAAEARVYAEIQQVSSPSPGYPHDIV